MNCEQKAVVIGAGLGGLSAAISLQSKGYQVVVVEKNQHVGGKLNQLVDEGYTFDLGPSILTMPHVFEELFERAGRRLPDYVDIQRLPLEWRSFFEDGTIIDLPSDLSEMLSTNPTLTQQDVQELERYLDYSRNMYDITQDGYFAAGLDTMLDVIRHYGVMRVLRGFDLFSTVDDRVTRFIDHPQLRDVLNFFVKYVGSSPYHAPAVLSLLPYIQNHFGLWYVKGGMYQLAGGIRRVAEEIGVEFRLGHDITSAEIDRGLVTAVSSAQGERFAGHWFVSNMEAIPFYEQVTRESESVLRDLDDFEPSCSGMVLHLGVSRTYPHLAHHNFFFSKNPRESFRSIYQGYLLPEDPTIYLVATTRTDPRTAPEGHENIKILPHIPYRQDRPFSEQDKAQFEARTLAKLERMGLDGLRDHTVYRDIWWPEDIEKMYRSNRGSIYGVVSDKDKNKGFKIPKQSSRYKNLYFVGGSINPGGGMPMVTMCGQRVADQLAITTNTSR